jgi:myosin-crossreactive antigen
MCAIDENKWESFTLTMHGRTLLDRIAKYSGNEPGTGGLMTWTGSSWLMSVGFDELMPKTLATATVDRLMHHAHVCQTSGDSIRLTQAIAGKGVVQLS